MDYDDTSVSIHATKASRRTDNMQAYCLWPVTALLPPCLWFTCPPVRTKKRSIKIANVLTCMCFWFIQLNDLCNQYKTVSFLFNSIMSSLIHMIAPCHLSFHFFLLFCSVVFRPRESCLWYTPARQESQLTTHGRGMTRFDLCVWSAVSLVSVDRFCMHTKAYSSFNLSFVCCFAVFLL